MENNVMNAQPFFNRIYIGDKKIKSIRYVCDSADFTFQTYASKTFTSQTLSRISCGLDHLLAWAKTVDTTKHDLKTARGLETYMEEVRFKEDFINRYNMLFHKIFTELTSPDFNRICYEKISKSKKNYYGKRPEEKDIKSEVLVGYVNELMDDDVLMTGILRYSYEYSNISYMDEPAATKNNMSVNLSKYDLFAITALLTISKIIQLSYSTYNSSSRSVEIVYRPLIAIIENIKDKIIKFYEEELTVSPMELQEVRENNYSANIITYFYYIIEKQNSSEKNRGVFNNIGMSDSDYKNEVFKTTLTSLFKLCPVLDTKGNKRKAIPFNNEPGDDWREYIYSTNTIIKFIATTIKHVSSNLSKHLTSAMSETINGDLYDANVTYKKEMTLEIRNNAALQTKKRLIMMLQRWCEETRLTDSMLEFEQHMPFDSIHIDDKTPLIVFMLTVSMNELNEDISSTRLIDINTMGNLLYVLAYRLNTLGFPKLSQALLAKSVVDDTFGIEKYIPKIQTLYKYKMNPERTERYIKDIISKAYVPQDSTLTPVEIGDEFIDFMKLLENKEVGDRVLINTHIYRYATSI